MRFLNKVGEEITLNKSAILPGYEIVLEEDVVIDSPTNNPFFKKINIVQLSKKIKGFRDDSDLETLFEPQAVDTKITLSLDSNEYTLFEPATSIVKENKLILINRIFGNNEIIKPLFINFGINKVILRKGTVIGTLIISKTN